MVGIGKGGMRILGRLFSLMCLMAFCVSSPFAATITGVVTGPDSAPFSGAFVQAQNTKTRITVSVLSAKQGGYLIEGLPAGEYRVAIRAVGYSAAPRVG